MRTVIFYFITLLSTFSWSQTQNITYSISPATFNETDEITLTFNGNSINESIWGVTGNALYLWAWSLDTNLSNSKDCPTNGTWEASNETNRLTYNAQNDTYSISFSPVTFFNRNGLGRIGFLLKAKNGSGDKKSQDITIDVGIFQLTLSEPTENTIVINQGQILNISATTTMPANF